MRSVPACLMPTRQEAAQRFEQLERDSENRAPILLNPEGDPVEITRAKLRSMCDEGAVTPTPLPTG